MTSIEMFLVSMFICKQANIRLGETGFFRQNHYDQKNMIRNRMTRYEGDPPFTYWYKTVF